MKQVLQSIKTGYTEIADVPVPKPSRGSLLIKTSKTLISSGTERMLVDFGKANMINKVRKQPDKLKVVLQKMKTDGVKPTIDAVLDKLDKPLPLGYCNAGKVIEIGSGVTEFSIGDRVVSNGKHADFVNVPVNLCAKIPNKLSYEDASFTVIGAVALQGVRLVKPTLGETVVVIGLGLVGLMAVQLLQANGCHVIGIDKDPKRLSLANNYGADVLDSSLHKNEIQMLSAFSGGKGVDAVLVAAASQSNQLMHQAASMCRQRGRIILVGSVGLELSRDDFFKKELTFQVSSSYGPGRYDQNYEEKGFDYPIGYVRWTEKRNFQAILNLMEKEKLNVSSLISHRFSVEDSLKAYDLISSSQPSLGILLSYNGEKIDRSSRIIATTKKPYTNKEALLKNTVSFIGSGNYATSTLIPAFKSAGAKLKSISSASGVSGLHAARKFGFHETTSDFDEILNDKDVQTVVIATRHDTHADLIVECLKRGKHVFVEKPLCLNIRELEKIQRIEKKSSSILMVGFNRRFSPHAKEIKKKLSNFSGPKAMIATINAGALPNDHWIHDPDIGGGRIIGEICHFVDLLRFLSGVSISKFQKFEMSAINKDTVTLNLNFSDGSIGTIHYFSNGSRSFPKERLEIFANGSILCLDNFRKLQGFGWPGFNRMKLWKQNKGQSDCVKEFLNAIKCGNPSPIPIEEIIEVSRVTLEASY